MIVQNLKYNLTSTCDLRHNDNFLDRTVSAWTWRIGMRLKQGRHQAYFSSYCLSVYYTAAVDVPSVIFWRFGAAGKFVAMKLFHIDWCLHTSAWIKYHFCVSKSNIGKSKKTNVTYKNYYSFGFLNCWGLDHLMCKFSMSSSLDPEIWGSLERP